MTALECRFCKASLTAAVSPNAPAEQRSIVIDLGMSPLANSYLTASQIGRMEPFYPLRLYVCKSCLLVQVEEVEGPAHIFSDYAYFSSYSKTWLEHSKTYCDQITARFDLNTRSHVVEIASNDGYLLQYFMQKKIPVLGIEPAANVAVAAINRGVPTLVDFFGAKTATSLAADQKQADLLIGNNVLAHVPDLNDFVKGMKILLKPNGVLTMEFPHLLNLIEQNQFDTVYHEHFSYFSFFSVQKIFAAHGIILFDVEKLKTHGGSLRIFGKHAENNSYPITERVSALNNEEKEIGLQKLEYYFSFPQKIAEVKCKILEFMIQAKRSGKKVAGFGAPAKGNTLLNYCGLRADDIEYTVDDTPAKQGRFLPGTHIPVYSVDKLKEKNPTTSSSCRGTSKTKSWKNTRMSEIGDANSWFSSPKSKSSPDLGAMKWLSLKQYRKISSFLGPKVVLLLFLGVCCGLAIFGIEFAFAYALQAFLVVLGVMGGSTIKIPQWIPHSRLGTTLFFVFIVGTLRSLLQWVQIYMQGSSLEELKYAQRERLLKWAFFSDTASSSQITALFNDRVNSAAAAVSTLQMAVVQAPVAILLGLSLFYLAPMPTLIAALLLFFLAFTMRILDRQLNTAGQGLRSEWNKTHGRLLMSIKNLLLMQIYGTETQEEAQAQKSLRAYLHHFLTFHKISGFKFVIPQIFGIGLICLIAATSRKSSGLPPQILISYFYLFMRFVQNFAELIKTTTAIRFYWSHLTELALWWANSSFDGLRNRRRLNLKDLNAVEAFPAAVGWKLENISYRYPGSQTDVLKNLTLNIAPGDAVVITGPSGAGKSTLIHLLLGGIEPTAGIIEAWSAKTQPQSLQILKPRVLRSIGYVGADIFLIEGTLYDNLTYGLSEKPSEERIKDALLKAECQFVLDLPLRLKHCLSEQGQGLSAGQKQRLSLARALLRNPLALILDEATANLDAATELKLVETLRRLKGEMTIIAVTHRKALLEIADQVLELD